MFRNILRPDSPLMLTMTQITDCIFLSLFWILGCFPVVTAGAASAALYDASVRTFRKGEKHCWSRFWQVFGNHWKQALVPTAVFLAALALLLWTGIRLWNSAVYGVISWGLFAGLAVVLLIPAGMLSLVFPLLSRFETTSLQLLGNTLRLALANMPLTMGLGLVNTATVFLCARYVVPLFFLPGLSALLSSVFIEPMLRPYMPAEDAA